MLKLRKHTVMKGLYLQTYCVAQNYKSFSSVAVKGNLSHEFKDYSSLGLRAK